MKTMMRALAKQLFGPRYERAGKSLLAAGILFAALQGADLSLPISPRILCLTSAGFPAGVMAQLLAGRGHRETVEGLLVAPFARRPFIFAYVSVLSAHALVTKTLPLWAILFAAAPWRPGEVAGALLWGGTACAVTAAGYGLRRQGHRLLPLLWAGGLLTVLLVGQGPVVLAAAAGSLGAAGLCLASADAYAFCPISPAGKPTRHPGHPGSVFVYLGRYLLANRNYLVNTAGLCVLAVLLPQFFGGWEGLDRFPMGLALLCLNTPLCTLLSGDPDLADALRVLPGGGGRFCRGYCGFLFAVNGGVAALYLVSWQVLCGGSLPAQGGMVLLFALQSAILSVLLEWKHPLRGWKTESDLWHHPRKYVVPLTMLLLAMLPGIWPPLLWCWSVLLCLEMIYLAWFLNKGRMRRRLGRAAGDVKDDGPGR